MQKLFSFDMVTRKVELQTQDVMLVREFADLASSVRDSDKLLKMFAYMQLSLAWDSPYSQYDEATRREEALKDSGLGEKDLKNQKFLSACSKFAELQDSNKSIRLLNAARKAAEKFIDYFENVVDLRERDKSGKPVYNTEKVMREMTLLNKVHMELTDLENRVKKEIADDRQIRAGAVEGFEDFDD